MLVSQGIGLVATTSILVLVGEAAPTGDSVVWAALAGGAGVIGLGFFYVALARGTMGVVAPLAALIGAGVPVLVAVIGGEHLAQMRMVGIGIALVAVVLISLPGRPRGMGERRALRIDVGELPFVVIAGLGFAGFFIGIGRAAPGDAIWWPLTVVRIVGFSVVVGAIAFAAWRRGAATAGGRVATVLGIGSSNSAPRSLAVLAPLLLITGAGDLGGNAFFVLANKSDAFSVAVVLSSLYPVVTAVIAALLLRERLRPVQVVGVVLATLSVPLLR